MSRESLSGEERSGQKIAAFLNSGEPPKPFADSPLILCVSDSIELAKDIVEWCGAFSEFAVAHTAPENERSVDDNSSVAAVVLDLSHIANSDIQRVREKLISYMRDFPSAHIIALVQKRVLEEASGLNIRKTDNKLALLKYPLSSAAFQVALSKAITQYDFGNRASVSAGIVTQLVSQVENEITRMLGLLHELSASQAMRNIAVASAPQPPLSIQRIATLNRAKRVILDEFSNDPYWSIIVELYLSELLNKLSDFKGIALKLGIPLATFTRRVDHMTEHGIVEREIDTIDKRRHRLKLTPAIRRQVELLLDG